MEKAREELLKERIEQGEGSEEEGQEEGDKSKDTGKRERKKKKFDDFVVCKQNFFFIPA